MSIDYVSRPIQATADGVKSKGTISVSLPEKSENQEYFCLVQFDPGSKYDEKVTGIDQIHALESAISYINSVCRNSEDPKYFWSNGDEMFVEWRT